jgi:YVTN family beta-propeller protein
VRFDYQSLDVASNRLYIAHMDADQLVVFDTKTRSVIANMAGFPSAHGVIAVPELNRVYASATGDHKVVAVDAETLKIIAKASFPTCDSRVTRTTPPKKPPSISSRAIRLTMSQFTKAQHFSSLNHRLRRIGLKQLRGSNG